MSDGLGLLFTRNYWLDEWHALLVANRPSPAQVIADLQGGSDFAPPFLHLTLWLLRVVTGGGELEPWIARSFTLLCVVAAVTFTFAMLRRRFDRSAAFVGALAVASHAMVVSYAFEVRFYAPWLMFAAMFAWSLGLASRRARVIAGAVAAIGLCTSHWFGVVSLGLMCLGTLLSHPERSEGSALRARINRIAPALVGIVALVACSPLLIGQRSSVSERSWIEELSWSQFAHLADTFWLALIPLLSLAIIAIAMVGSRGRSSRSQAASLVNDPSLAALLALAAMPVALVILSLLQPVMLDRYALTSLLAWAPLAAFAAHVMPRAARYAAVGVLAIVGLARVGAQIGIARQVAGMIARDQALLQQHCGRGTVAFMTRIHMYYHTSFIRSSCPSARYLALSNDRLERLFAGPNASVQRLYRSENEFAVMHERAYDFPRVIEAAALDSLTHFVVMAEPSSLPRNTSGRELFSPIVFPNHRVVPLDGNGFLYERR